MVATATEKEQFIVEVIKPSHYDDDGYVIQWHRAYVPSNSLGCVNALAVDAKQRYVLGENVELVINSYDENHTLIRPQKIIRRMKKAGGKGIVLLTGVQSNQFPRAADLAKEFHDAGVHVAIGGFHVSGCISMLNELPPEIQEVQDAGITLFAGEGENGRLDTLFQDSYNDELKPVYNYLLDLPDLEGTVTPFLPPEVSKRTFNFTAFDVGRGCPFRCSFCTIINVQGRKSRHRDADDVEQLVRTYVKYGVKRFFITDDNMARNKNWESIFDRLIKLREEEGIRLKMLIQVDTQCHKIPNFIEKATKAGCNRVFIGMESVNAENLKAAKKYQNKISEYRKMLQKWRDHGALTHAGYILGFPSDTPQSIEEDIRLMQRELPIDVLEFFIMTPLPGSADHKELYEKGVWMDPDMNLYDTEHVVTAHPKMTNEEWLDIYKRAWHLYYSPEHIKTLMRRGNAGGCGAGKILGAVLIYYATYRYENIHPLQGGILRRKIRTTRRPTFPRENPLLFYPKRLWETAKCWIGIGLYALQLERMRRKIAAEPNAEHYMDAALERVVDEVPAPVAATDEGCETTGPEVVSLSTLKPLPIVTKEEKAA